MKIFIIAILIRTAVYFLMPGNPSFISFDSWEYYYNSQELQVWDRAAERLGYAEWYYRTPAYTLFLYLIRPDNAIAVQIIISSLTVLLLYKLNYKAGWMFCFYPISIFGSFQYMKETLLIFLIISGVYVIEKHFYIWLDNVNNVIIRFIRRGCRV
jgi:hypothetical protein